MTTPSTSTSTNQASVQTELFRPSLTYPVHPYDEIVTRTAERYPEYVAIVSKEVNLTYRELEALVNAFANALQELGVNKGQKVCLFMTNRAEYVISWFAVIRLGATVSPINPSYKKREVAYQIDNSESVAVVVQHDLLPLVEARRTEMPHLQYVIVVGSDQHHPSSNVYAFSRLVRNYPPTPTPRPQTGREDMVALHHSSGTHGLPKGVMLSHKNLMCNAYQSIATARTRFEHRLLGFLP